MVKETIKVKSKDFGEFEYELEQPESIAEAVQAYGETESLEWLQAGRKAEINAKEWAKVRGTKTEEIEVGGKTYRVAKELVAILQAAKGVAPAA